MSGKEKTMTELPSELTPELLGLVLNEEILEEIFLLLEKLPRNSSSRDKISKPMSISLSVCGDLSKYLPELLSKISQKKDG